MLLPIYLFCFLFFYFFAGIPRVIRIYSSVVFIVLSSWKDDVPQSESFEAFQDITLVDDNHGCSGVTPRLYFACTPSQR
jgi:hypothetical protein